MRIYYPLNNKEEVMDLLENDNMSYLLTDDYHLYQVKEMLPLDNDNGDFKFNCIKDENVDTIISGYDILAIFSSLIKFCDEIRINWQGKFTKIRIKCDDLCYHDYYNSILHKIKSVPFKTGIITGFKVVGDVMYGLFTIEYGNSDKNKNYLSL